jgi:hypothetical protein
MNHSEVYKKTEITGGHICGSVKERTDKNHRVLLYYGGMVEEPYSEFPTPVLRYAYSHWP